MTFVISVVSGAISAMGIGGGVILIPALTGFLHMAQKDAQYINLLYFVPVAICALIIHAKAGRVSFKRALFMVLGGIPGALLGSYVAEIITTGLLKRIFGVFLLVIGIKQLRNSRSGR